VLLMTTTTPDQAQIDLAPDSSTGAFLAALAPHRERALVFEHAGRQILPGYHVTEVMAATFASMDCGGRPEQWQETIIQLWDIPGDADTRHMTVGKFLGIYDKVTAKVPVSPDATLTLEWGDDVSPALRHRPLRLHTDREHLVVEVGAVQATCKPRDDRYAASREDKPVLAPPSALPLAQPPAGGCCS